MIKENDEFFVHFFIVAFLEFYKDTILSVDYSQIPSILSQLNIKSIADLEKIAKRAKEIKQQTPYSFKLLAKKLEIYKPRSNRLKELFLLYEPESLLCLPVLPSEVFFIAYNNIVGCPDYDCGNFKNIDYNDIFGGKHEKSKLFIFIILFYKKEQCALSVNRNRFLNRMNCIKMV